MTMQRRLYVAAALASTLATAPVAVAGTPPPGPTAVLAVNDTGINPYHAAFRDRSPRARQHPSTYLPGYPRTAIALPITLDAPDYWTAVRRDCRLWKTVKPGTLYWFPGTKIVGAVSFDPTKTGMDCSRDQPAGAPILDEHGHGTMTASRAAGAPWGACQACRLVSLQFQAQFGAVNGKAAAASAEATVAWAGANSGWIDAQSNSWGVLPVPDATGEGGFFFDHPSLTRVVEDTARRHLSFWSSGNGPMNLGVAGIPTVGAHFTPSAIRVGAHDSGLVTTWSGQTPHLVADGCDSWAAKNRTLDEWDERHGGGTSAAAPYAAGAALDVLWRARLLTGDRRTGVRDGVVASGARVASGPLADGALGLAEWRDLVFRTATPRPEAQRTDGPPCPLTDPQFHPVPVAWRDVPADAPAYPLVGYGAPDAPAVERAALVLRGKAQVPVRPGEDAWFAADRAAREATHPVHRL